MGSKPPPPAPPPPSKNAKKESPRATVPAAIRPTFTTGVKTGADRIVIYGTGGIGKTTLAAYLPSPIFLDVEDGSRKLNVSRDSASNWIELRGKLAWLASGERPDSIRSVVLDTATVAEELAKEHIIGTRKASRSSGPSVYVESIEEYGWGKGWQFVYDEFCGLLADMDRIVASGVNVCIIAHQVSSPFPNPAGEDYIRWEPHLYAGDKKGRGSIRELLKNWSEHVLFIGYDVMVEGGKGIGVGNRTIFTQELPTHIAKSRTVQGITPFELSDPGAIWQQLGIQ